MLPLNRPVLGQAPASGVPASSDGAPSSQSHTSPGRIWDAAHVWLEHTLGLKTPGRCGCRTDGPSSSTWVYRSGVEKLPCPGEAPRPGPEQGHPFRHQPQGQALEQVVNVLKQALKHAEVVHERLHVSKFIWHVVRHWVHSGDGP